jgi:hypothetical protein
MPLKAWEIRPEFRRRKNRQTRIETPGTGAIKRLHHLIKRPQGAVEGHPGRREKYGQQQQCPTRHGAQIVPSIDHCPRGIRVEDQA